MRRLAIYFPLLLTASISTVQAGQWSGWSVIPGGGTTDRTVAALYVGQGALHVYSKGINDRAIYENLYATSLSQWSTNGWQPIAGSFQTSQSPAAVHTGFGTHIFAQGAADQKVYVNVQAESARYTYGSFQGWQEVPGGGQTDQALAAAEGGTKAMVYLFMKGLDGHVYVNARDWVPAQSWSGWQEVPGGATTDVGLTASNASRSHKIYLFRKGPDDHSYVTQLDVLTGQWSGTWTEVPGGGTTNKALAATVAGDTLYLFAIGIGDKHQYMNRMHVPDETWTGWESVDGGGTTDVGDAATSESFGKIYLLSKGIIDHKIYWNRFTP